MSTKFLQGEYVATITTWGLGESRHKKTPEFTIRFRPIGKVNPNDPEGDLIQCPDDERSLYRYITQKTIDFFREDLEYLGYDKESFKYLNPDVSGAHDFSGKQINVRCDYEEFEGKTREKWKLVRGGVQELVPLEDKKVRELDALYGKSLKSLASKSNGGSTKPETAATAPTDDDSIPF